MGTMANSKDPDKMPQKDLLAETESIFRERNINM